MRKLFCRKERKARKGNMGESLRLCASALKTHAAPVFTGESLRTMRSLRLRFHMFLVILLTFTAFARAATQTVVLEAGWNLVSIQVGGSLSMTDFAAALDVPDALRAAWGRDPATGVWSTWQADVPGFTGDLEAFVPGCGYWVKVSESTILELDGAPWEGAVAIRPGWNLVGFQGLAETSLENLFGANIDAVQQVWTFDAASGGVFRGYDTTALPRLRDVVSVEPGRGYWVYALRDVLLAPEPEILLVADADAAPLQATIAYAGAEPKFLGRRVKFAGVEDAANDLNGNGILDDAWTQDAVRFPIGVDFQPVIVGNVGGGALNWSVIEDVPWLSIDGPDSGVVSSAKAYTYLKVDRTGLEPGTYASSNVWVRAGGLEKRVTVSIEVATAAGDFKGYAIAERVNGKEIALGKVDLGLSLFMESDRTDETRFRAVIDRERSLLFPKDVFMDGVFYSGNEFTLATTFSMQAGDRNAPPFDTFSQPANGADPQGHGDRDWNGDGVLDNDNPFPYDIRRGISLLGKRIDENTFSGTYSETLQGMLPNDEKILIEGTFRLSRQTFEPTRRSIYNGENLEMQIVGASGTTVIEKTIEVEDSVRVQTAIIGLSLDFPRPDLVHVELVSPSGTTVSLHDGGPQILSGYNVTDFDGEIGQGTWTLRVSWNPASGERGRFHSWTLDLGGIVTYAVSGRLIDGATSSAVANVPWVLTGGTVVYQGVTDNAGRFHVEGLTENNYGFSFHSPGLVLLDTHKAQFSIEDADVNLGNLRASLDSSATTDPPPSLSPNASDGRFQLQNCAFIGSGAGIGQTASLSPGTWTLLEWQRDCAAFDIDRWPTGTFNPRAGDTDFYVQPDTDYFRIISGDREPADTYYDVHELAPGAHPDRYRMECTMGGFVFGEDAARASGLYIQSGRIEP